MIEMPDDLPPKVVKYYRDLLLKKQVPTVWPTGEVTWAYKTVHEEKDHD